jgi:arylsulfatase A-like enzyme
VDTPHIDALIREGVAFPRAFAHAPMTLPSHTALFSSRYPFESGVLNNGQPVPRDVPLLAEHLSDLGYQTRAVVSLGTLWPRREEAGTTLDRGFDTYVATPGHVTPAPLVRATISKALDGVDADRPLFLFAHFSDPHEPYNVHGARADGLPPFEADLLIDGEKVDRVTTSDATHWVRSVELEPGPHRFEVTSDWKVNVRLLSVTVDGRKVPLRLTDADTGTEYENLRGKGIFHPLAEFENPTPRTQTFEIEAWVTDHPMGRNVPYRYFREVDFVDGYIGELVAELKARGLFDNSAVVFTSDHGEALREHSFTGHVQNLHDEMTHVPLLIKPPLGHPASEALAAVARDVVRHVDVVPTLLEIAALPALKGQRGLSLLRAGERPVISETHRPEAKESQIAVRDAQHKLVYYIERDVFELYDLERDPFELKDVFADQGERFREWQQDLKTMAALSKRSGVRLEDLSESDRKRMEALGYFGEDGAEGAADPTH